MLKTLWLLLGLGDIMVFIFFRLFLFVVAYFLFTKSFDWDILFASLAIGLLSAAVLNLNNMRDIENDEKSGKKNIGVEVGFQNAMIYEMIILVLPPILVLMYMMINHLQEQGKYYAFIFCNGISIDVFA